jgi:cytochrome c-type biogenesis protein CcmH/NrfF
MPAFVFAPYDNPMHLSKVGNWVITFVSDAQAEQTILAFTYVIPRQQSEELQPRRVLIQQSLQHEHHWIIQSIECYNANNQQDHLLDLNSPITVQILKEILQEFQKYDVEMTIE